MRKIILTAIPAGLMNPQPEVPEENSLEYEARRLAIRNYNQQHIVGMRSSPDSRERYVDARWQGFVEEARKNLAEGNPLEDECYTCNTCYKLTPTLDNGRCAECAHAAHIAWQERIAKRIPIEQFDLRRLVNLLLTSHWMHECEIVYDPEAEKKCLVKYTFKNGATNYLRYDGGALASYFWDIGGDDFHRPEVALLAIGNSPPPNHIDRVIPTYGN